MYNNLISKILSQNEINIMKEKINILLSEKGVKIDHPEVLKRLSEAGAEVLQDEFPPVVKFPIPLIEEALKTIPRSFTLAARDPKFDLPLPNPEGMFYTRTNTGGLNYYTENNEYRQVTLEDAVEWTRLSQVLENIDFCSLPSVSTKEVPVKTVDIHSLKVVFENTTKHIWLQPYEAKNIKYLIEMAALIAGGKEALKERPIVSFISCSHTPLEYKYMDMEVILQSCIHGIPIQACSLPTAGANVPVTIPSAVLVASAEVLAMAVIAQLIVPGTPVIATPLLFSLDMMSTATLQSPIEITMGRMAAMQLFEEGYGIPAHTYGTGTDSSIPDGQAMIEAVSTAQMVALSGASVLGGAGQIETAKTLSPLQLIIDNDIFGMVKKLKKGLSVDDETLAWEDVLESTGREGFIDTEHTFRHFRETLRPKTFTRVSRARWEEQGSKDTLSRATEVLNSLRNSFESVNLSESQLEELEAIVSRADQDLAGKS